MMGACMFHIVPFGEPEMKQATFLSADSLPRSGLVQYIFYDTQYFTT
jgi:hypothetical protein